MNKEELKRIIRLSLQGILTEATYSFTLIGTSAALGFLLWLALK